MPDGIWNLKDIWLFLRQRLAACCWELLQIIYSQWKAGLTWHGCHARSDYSSILFGALGLPQPWLNGSERSAVVMAIVISQMWLQVSPKHRWEAMGRRQRDCHPPGAARFLVQSSLLHAALSLVEQHGSGTDPASLTPQGSGTDRNKQVLFHCSQQPAACPNSAQSLEEHFLWLQD